MYLLFIIIIIIIIIIKQIYQQKTFTRIITERYG